MEKKHPSIDKKIETPHKRNGTEFDVVCLWIISVIILPCMNWLYQHITSLSSPLLNSL
jgi:hypothetical protein